MAIKLNYRRINEFDKEYLEFMLYETIFTLSEEQLPSPDIIDTPAYQKYISPWTSEDIGYIATDPVTQETVGAVWLRFFTEENPGIAYINDKLPELTVVVDSTYRNNGVGTDLVHYLMAQLPTTVQGICLGVDIRNPILKFFERLGFTPFKINKTIVVMRYDRH